jgi:hypothetical protein
VPWTRRQVRFLESSGSPLSKAQKDKMNRELHDDPALGHHKKGSSAMKDHGMRRMEIEVHRDGAGKITGHTVTHTPYEKPKSSKSGAFYQEPKRSEFPFSAKDHKSMLAHISEHLGADAATEPEAEGKK